MKNFSDKFIRRLNTFRKGSIITRQSLLKRFPEKHKKLTVDNYRLTLTRAGYLEQTNTPGEYKIIKKIPLKPMAFFKDLQLKEYANARKQAERQSYRRDMKLMCEGTTDHRAL